MTELKRPIVARMVLGIALILLLIQTADYLNFTVDDIFISMRVAENAAMGHGMVYNIGENVEGYSNPLWVWMLTGAAATGINQSCSPLALLWFAKGMSFLFGLLTMLLLYRLTKNIYRDSEFRNLFASLSVLFAAMTAPYIAWMCGGLEMTFVGFFYLLASSAAYTIFERVQQGEKISRITYWKFSFSFIIASLARPEPMLFAASAFLLMIIVLPKNEKKRSFIFSILPYAFALSVFFWFRWNIYHDLLPNTFYAKTGGGARGYFNGIKYLGGALGEMCAPLLVIIPFAFKKGLKKNSFLAFLTLIVSTAFFFILYSTGDWMPGARFIIPIASLLFLLAIMGFSNLFEIFLNANSQLRLSILPFCLTVGCIAFIWCLAGRVTLRGESPGMQSGFFIIKGHSLPSHVQVGEWFKENVHDTSTVALGEAGIIGYMNPQLRILDLNGLMDRHIAAMRKESGRFDTEYIFDRKPKYILLFGSKDVEHKLVNKQSSTDYFTALFTNSRLTTEYSVVALFENFEIYQRKD